MKGEQVHDRPTDRQDVGCLVSSQASLRSQFAAVQCVEMNGAELTSLCANLSPSLPFPSHTSLSLMATYCERKRTMFEETADPADPA